MLYFQFTKKQIILPPICSKSLQKWWNYKSCWLFIWQAQPVSVLANHNTANLSLTEQSEIDQNCKKMAEVLFINVLDIFVYHTFTYTYKFTILYVKYIYIRYVYRTWW